jgi:hypothetical protein
MSVVKWMNNFSPSFIRKEEIEMVIEEWFIYCISSCPYYQ